MIHIIQKHNVLYCFSVKCFCGLCFLTLSNISMSMIFIKQRGLGKDRVQFYVWYYMLNWTELESGTGIPSQTGQSGRVYRVAPANLVRFLKHQKYVQAFLILINCTHDNKFIFSFLLVIRLLSLILLPRILLDPIPAIIINLAHGNFHY